MSAALDLAAHYVATHPEGVARHLERLAVDDAATLLADLPADAAATVLPHVAAATAARLLSHLPVPSAAAVAAQMPVDIAVPILRRADDVARAGILDALPDDRRAGIASLLLHQPGTAGSVMDPHVVTVPAGVTVGEARALLQSDPSHIYYYVFVLDADHRLAGVLDLAELMQADPKESVRAVARTSVTWLSADAALPSVFAHPGWRTLDALPVVDAGGRFAGVLRHRRMRQLQEHGRSSSTGDPAMATMMALGEMYWLGLSGLLHGMGAPAPSAMGVPGETR